MNRPAEEDPPEKPPAPASMLPMLGCFLAVILALLELGVVVPRFKETFQNMNVELPAMTQLVLSLSDFVANQWYLLVPLVGGVVLPWALRREKSARAYGIATALLAAWVLLVVPATVFIPIWKLQQSLEQK